MPLRPWIVALFLVSPVTAGCGDDAPTAPTPRPLTNESISEATVQGQAFGCVTFRQEAAGPAYASHGVPLPIELGTGTCTNRGPVIARGDRGDVTLLLPVGDHYVRFQNPTNFAFTYRVTLRYLILV